MIDEASQDTEVARPGVVVAAVATAIGLVLFDSLSVATALPSIQTSFKTQTIGVEWIVNGFSIALAGLLLVGGRLGAVYGPRRSLWVSLGVLALATMIAGTAPAFSILLTGRILQGCAAAVALPNAMGLVGQLFPTDPWRRRGFAAMAFAGGACGILGAIVGSAITVAVGWRWIFLASVPIALLSMVAIVVFVPARVDRSADRGGRPHSLDGLGALLATVALMTVMFGLDHVATRDIAATITWLPLVGGAVLIMVFLRHERRAEQPLVPLSLLRSKRLMSNAFSIGGASIVHTAVVVVGSLYFQQEQGLTAFQAGLRIAPELVAVSLGSVIAPQVLSRVGSKHVAIVCLGLCSCALVWLAWGTRSDSYLVGQVVPLVVLGLANGINYVAATRASVGEAAEEASAVSAIETVDEAIRSVALSVIVEGPDKGEARRTRLLARVRAAGQSGLGFLRDSVYSGAASVFEASSHVAGAFAVVVMFGLLGHGVGFAWAYLGAAVLVAACCGVVTAWMPAGETFVAGDEARHLVAEHVRSARRFLRESS